MKKYFTAYNSVTGLWEARIWINEIDSEAIETFEKELSAKEYLKLIKNK